MYKSIALFVAGAALALGGCKSSEFGRQMPVTGDVVATVNGVEIRNSEVNMNTMARQQMRQPISPEDSLKEVINIELLRQAALKQGLDKDPKVQEQINDLGIEINRHTSNILIQAYLAKLEAANTDNSAALQKAYDDYVATLPSKEYKARHILSKTREEALANIKALKKGANFAKLADQKSMDKTPGGDLGWANPDSFVKEFSVAMQALEPGKYSQEPVQTQFGWHVILLEDVRDSKAPAMDEVRAQLQRATRGKMIENNIEELRKAASIDIKNPAPAAPASEPSAETPSAPAS
jgi:peptidyl-prolyl cis-trans isomerase C